MHMVCITVSCAVKEYYTKYRDNTICEVFAPHLHIYLDAPVNVLRERINKRNKVIYSLFFVNFTFSFYCQDCYQRIQIAQEVSF